MLKKDVIKLLKARLYTRQLQQARYGINTEPSITIEIEDLPKLIKDVESITDVKKDESNITLIIRKLSYMNININSIELNEVDNELV